MSFAAIASQGSQRGGEKEKLLPSPGSRFRCGDMVLWWRLVLGEEGKGTEVGLGG